MNSNSDDVMCDGKNFMFVCWLCVFAGTGKMSCVSIARIRISTLTRKQCDPVVIFFLLSSRPELQRFNYRM